MPRSNTRLAAALVACSGAMSTAGAQTASVLLREGDPLPAAPGHLVTTIGEPTTNSVGGYATGLTSSDGVTTLSHSWGNVAEAAGNLLFSEQTNIAGYDQTAWEGFFGIDNLGRTAYSPTCNVTGGGATGLDCTWIDGTPIAIEGQPILALPGMVFRFNSRVGMASAVGEPYWIGGINTAGGANMGEGLFFGAGQLLGIKTGDPSPAPLTSTITDCDFDVRFSAAAAHWIMNVDTTDAAGGDEWLLIDGSIAMCNGGGLVGEGQVVPVAAGGDGVEAWTATFGSLGINDAGDHCYEADTTAAAGIDGVIVLNGAIRWREGDVVDGLTLTGAPLALSLNENGDVAHSWSTTGGIEAIFFNDELLVKEGDLIDWTGDGVADAGFVLTDIAGITTLALGAPVSGSAATYFHGDVDTNGGGTLAGFFRVRAASPGMAFCYGDGTGAGCPCANETPVGANAGCFSSLGLGGKLVATGSASISADTITLLGSQMPNSSALYFQGTNQSGFPAGSGTAFGDGKRCAGGTTIRLKTVTNVAGTSHYPDVVDAPVSVRGAVSAPGTRTYQVWYRNAAAFCTQSTFNLTNGWSIAWNL